MKLLGNIVVGAIVVGAIAFGLLYLLDVYNNYMMEQRAKRFSEALCRDSGGAPEICGELSRQLFR